MLTLHTFEPFHGARSASPFTLKAEALLLMAGLPYETKFGMLRKAPQGKLPVLEDDGVLIPDSALIKRHLEMKHGADFDGHLDASQHAVGTAAQRLIENHLYFINGEERWSLHGDKVRDEFFHFAPTFLRGFIFAQVNKGRRKAMHGQGLGRHTAAQLSHFAGEDWAALSGILGDKPFLLGDEPSSYDASLWGALHGVTACTLDTPSRRQALSYQNLIHYRKRFEDRFLPE